MPSEKKRANNLLPAEPDLKERIRQSATRVFAEKGYYGASMKEIAETAGVNKALLFYYFNSKENLYSEVLKSIPERMAQLIEEHIARGTTFLEKLKMAIKGYLTGFEKYHCDSRIIIYSVLNLAPPQPFSISGLMNRVHEPLINLMENGKKDGILRDVDPVFLARAIGGAIVHNMEPVEMHNKTPKEIERLKSTIERNFDILMETGVLIDLKQV